MTRSLRSFGGELMIINSAIHTAVGVALYAGTVSGLVSDGLLNTVHLTREREAAWWFFVVGLLYLTVGLFLRWIRRQNLAPPRFPGWILIGLATVGLIVAPSIGWPFIAAVGVLVLASRSPSRAGADAPRC